MEVNADIVMAVDAEGVNVTVGASAVVKTVVSVGPKGRLVIAAEEDAEDGSMAIGRTARVSSQRLAP